MEPRPIDQLIDACRNNDRSAQYALFGQYKGMILRLVYRFLGPRSKPEIEDVVQQVFIELFKSLTRFRGEASFETWIYRIAARVCLQAIRRKYRKRVVSVASVDHADLSESEDNTYFPSMTLEKKEKMRALYLAMEQIPAERRVVFILHEIEGKSIDEITRIEHVRPGTVKSRLFRARKDLAERLEKADMIGI